VRSRADASRIEFRTGLLFLLGVWLVLAPFVLDASEASVTQLTNDLLVGAILIAIALLRYSVPAVTVSLAWVTMGVGGWLVLAPFVLEPASGGQLRFNNVVVGLATLSLGCAAIARPLSRRRRR
jgi:hypothetical protein